MRIAIPVASGTLCVHFGHCEAFALVDVDTDARTIGGRQDVTPPAHQPGMLPGWIAEQGVGLVIAGGMGQRAQDLLRAQGIDVLVGVPSQTPEQLATYWLAGTLATGENTCDH